MSYSVDVNILLYASDSASPWHRQAVHFLEGRPHDPEPFCLCWPTLMAYLRIATHPRIFSQPLSPGEALANLGALLNLPRARVVGETEGFLEVYRNVTADYAARGNLVPDAHLAAILRQHDVPTLYTADTDFRRFPFLQLRNPLS